MKHNYKCMHDCYYALFITLQESCVDFSNLSLQKLVIECISLNNNDKVECTFLHDDIKYLLSNYWLSCVIPFFPSSST